MASGSRVWCCAKFGEILLIGENLRMRMHTSNPHLIKDRRYFMKTHPTTFIGSECLDWLLSTEQIPNREMGICIMNILIENNIIHHVGESSTFKDDSGFYRFRKDDGTYPWAEDIAIFLRGQRIYQKLHQDQQHGTLKTQEENGVKYKRSVNGSQFVDWLLKNCELQTREDGVEEGRLLLQNDVIRHVTDRQHFKDEPLLYQFKIDYSRTLELVDLVLPPEHSDSDDEHDHTDGNTSSARGRHKSSSRHKVAPTLVKDSVDTSSCSSSGAKDIPPSVKDRPTRSESGYHSDLHDSPSSPVSTFQETVAEESEPVVHTALKRVSSLQLASPTGVLIRKATVDELLAEDSPFVKRPVRVAQDPVGYGFVIRGDSPVYVKTVDPMGPAAKAGLRVGHFIYSINDEMVLRYDHRELAHIIVNSNGYMNMTVMEHVHDQKIS